MTPPLVENQDWATLADVAPTRTRTRRVTHSLSWGRLLRAMRRQSLLFLAFVIGSLSAAALYIYATHASNEALLVWGAFGAATGLAFATSRELSRSTLGAVSSIRRHSGYAVIGAAPELTRQELRDLAPDMRNPRGCLVYHPASAFAAAFRELRESLDGAQLVAFIGAAHNEGATTSALSFALSAQQHGKRVIILDCDLRRRSLTHSLGFETEVGMMEVALKPDIWQGVIETEAETGLHVVPAAKLHNPWRTLFGMPGFTTALTQMRAHYDLIVLDCPPALTEGAMIARHADKRVVVATWDETPTAALRATVRSFRHQPPVSTGVLLNRTPTNYRFIRE